MKMSRILVTGGTGFIGAVICESLVEQGHRVTVLDNNSRGHLGRISSVFEEVQYLPGDIRDFDTVRKAIQKQNKVVHLAFINGTENFYSQPKNVLDVAIVGMQNMVQALSASEVAEFFLASSSEVYQVPPIFPTPEDVPLVVPDVFNARYSYGLGKIVQEFMAFHYLDQLERVLVFRPHNIFGPDMGCQHVVPELFEKICNSKNGTVELKGDGSQRRTFCHIDDFRKGFELLFSSHYKREIVNIGTNFEHTVMELAEKIAQISSKNIKFLTTVGPAGEATQRIPDLQKLSSLGYQPGVTLEAGLKDYYSWFTSK
jgi:dTDP-glucose 4,6-dehydratase/UDP-glucose 4-epimerase